MATQSVTQQPITHREIERKYDVGLDFAVPDLIGVPGVAAVEGPDETLLEATYFDTPDLRLLGAKTTLRRRTGGSDEGWHLKVPGPDGARDEIHLPLGRAVRAVPAPLLNRVKVHSREAKPVPVATIKTRRTTYRLLDSAGALLAEVADDQVTARALARGDSRAAETLTWREIEVELGVGDRSLLDAVGELLLADGAVPAGRASKVAQVLGEPSRKPAAGPPTPTSAASAVVGAALRGLVADLKAWDPRVRTDEPDAVHQMRVTIRRLRSVLRVYRSTLERAEVDAVRDELKWLATELGAARDAEVLHATLLAEIEAEPAELVLGPVHARVDSVLTKRYHDAHREVLASLDSPRYLALLDRLDALTSAPPWTAKATRPAVDVLPRGIRSSWRRVRRFADRAGTAEPGPDRDRWLHEVRKAAKRLRYAAEAAEPVLGKAAKRLGKRVKSLQQPLGEFQDTVVARTALRDLGVQAHQAGENAFTFGRLHGVQEGRAAEAIGRYDSRWKKVVDKLESTLYRWLR